MRKEGEIVTTMTTGRARIRLLDILRGFAILGTLGTNIWLFANLTDIAYMFTVDHAAWWVSFDDFLRLAVLFLVNGKLLGLLTIMFGVGLELKYQQALRKGKTWPGVYVWTSVILLLEGLLHFTLVMEFDILMSYAVTAIIVSFVVKRGDRAINRTMKVVGCFHLIVILLIFFASVWLEASGANVSFGKMDEVTVLYKEGTWLEQVAYRLNNFLLLRSEVIFVIPMNIFLFLTGVRLMRAGAFLPNETGRSIRQKMLRVGMLLGVPLNVLIFVPGGVLDLPLRYLFAPILAIGYMALIAKMVERSENFWLWSRLEGIGKMALSCYVLQNTLSAFIFYGWGLGLGGKLDSLSTIAAWVLISLVQISFSALWLHAFKLGPMEAVRKYLARVTVGEN
nr:DUF418 domain-containing protein [Numidum massiliense]